MIRPTVEDLLRLSDSTVRSASALGVKSAATLATATKALRDTRASAATAEAAIPATAEALRAAEAAWTADQTPAKWSSVEAARAARDQAELRHKALRDASERAAAALPSVLASVLSDERTAHGADYHRETVPALVEYLEASAALEAAGRRLGEIATAAHARGSDIYARLRASGGLAAEDGMPFDLRSNTVPWLLGGAAISKAFTPRVSASPVTPFDRLASDPRDGSNIERAAVTAASERFNGARAASPEAA